jgi:hypothetical protein
MSKKKNTRRPADRPDWFKEKFYLHFDCPIQSPAQVRDLVESPAAVARHAFLPFIRFEKTARKYKQELRKFIKKARPLSYAGHTDSQIFRYYNWLLYERYERLLESVP